MTKCNIFLLFFEWVLFIYFHDLKNVFRSYLWRIYGKITTVYLENVYRQIQIEQGFI